MLIPIRNRSIIIAFAIASKSTFAFNSPTVRKKAINFLPCSPSWVTNRARQSVASAPMSSALFSTLETKNSDIPGVWYSDPNLKRSDVPKVDEETLKSSRFIIMASGERGDTRHLHAIDESRVAAPIFLNYEEVNDAFGVGILEELAEGDSLDSIFAWIGERDQCQYFAVYKKNHNDSWFNSLSEALENREDIKPAMLPLREFGDRLMEATDAAIHSTANALIEFHKAHKFCPSCGSPTLVRKVGASRICSDHTSLGGSCKTRSIYPRIDLASIMLVTTQCSKYALLGRKSNWPSGRYSTLAGFLEVGETIEDCCIRETFEESGVQLDRSTVEFRKSQPWPFPRSLMVGFRAKAVGIDDKSTLPRINFDEIEMEDVRWFAKDYVRERLDGGSTALMYNPTEDEMEFHIPGKASLARALITEWALED